MVQINISLPRIVQSEAAFWHTVLEANDFLDEIAGSSDRSLACLLYTSPSPRD